MQDKDLESQFEELFRDDSLESEVRPQEDELLLEEAITDLLREESADFDSDRLRSAASADFESDRLPDRPRSTSAASAEVDLASKAETPTPDAGTDTADIDRPSADDAIPMAHRASVRGSGSPTPISSPSRPARFLPPAPERFEEIAEGVTEEREHPSPTSSKLRLWKITLGDQQVRALGILLRGVTILGAVLLIFLLTRLIWWRTLIWPRSDILYFVIYAVFVAISLIQWLFNSSLSNALHETEDQYASAALAQTQLKDRTEELATANALLQKRALQFQTAMLIAQAIGPVLDPQRLQQEAVDLIRKQFDLYYVGLFLIDEPDADATGQWAVLRAGTGEAGQQMLERGYRLKLDDRSTVGWCIIQDQARISPDLQGSRSNGRAANVRNGHAFPERPTERLAEALAEVNLPLPETRSVMTLPLRSRDRVLGALDVHSADRAAFSEEDIAILQAVADQVAIAIDNAHLFAEKQASLEEMETRQRRYLREQWADLASPRTAPSYERTQPGVPSLDYADIDHTSADIDPDRLRSTSAASADNAIPMAHRTSAATTGDLEELGQAIRRAMEHSETVVRPSAGNGQGQSALVTPISLRGEALGALGLQDEEERQWTTDEVALIEAVADQMAVAIENARLLGETQRRAERERLSADISAQIRSSTEIDTILRTAIQEIGRALGASDGLIRLGEHRSSIQGDNEPGSTYLGQEGDTENDHAGA